MAAPQDNCWLCNKFGPMTKEHIPPERAFNDFPLLLMKVDERSSHVGKMDWVRGPQFGRGMYVRSVGARCNNRCGSKYGGAYVDLVRRVAERIGDIQEFHTISILAAKRPLAILKQIVFQFVSTSGPGLSGPMTGWDLSLETLQTNQFHLMWEFSSLHRIAGDHDAPESPHISISLRVLNSTS